MAWNKDNPVPTEKARLYSDVITANNTAIEQNEVTVLAESLNQWVVHLVDRNTIGGLNTPDRIDTIGMLYCRDDTHFNELFFQDSQTPSKKIQLTSDGHIGYLTTKYKADTITFDGTRTFDEENVVVAWGFVNAAGTMDYGTTGVTSVRGAGTGLVTISFPAGMFTDAKYSIVAMGSDSNAVWYGGVNTATEAYLITRKNHSGDPSNRALYFMVVGGQV